MALNAKKAPKSGGSKFPAPEPMEPGTYPARLVQVIDLGMQEQRAYQGVEKPPAHSILLTWECTDEFMKDEEGEDDETRPRWLSEQMPLHNLDADLAKSTKRYKALDPNVEEEGDWSALIGSCANVEVNQYQSKQDGSTRNAVKNVLSMRPKDSKKQPDLINPPKTFDLEEPDLEIFESLPQWLQDKIKGNLEYDGSVLQDALGEGKKKKKKTKEEPKKEEAEDEDDQVDDEKVDDDNDDDELPWD